MSPFFENVFARPKATSMGSPNADKAITSAENSHQVFTPSLPLSGPPLPPHEVMDGILNSDYIFLNLENIVAALKIHWKSQISRSKAL